MGAKRVTGCPTKTCETLKWFVKRSWWSKKKLKSVLKTVPRSLSDSPLACGCSINSCECRWSFKKNIAEIWNPTLNFSLHPKPKTCGCSNWPPIPPVGFIGFIEGFKMENMSVASKGLVKTSMTSSCSWWFAQKIISPVDGRGDFYSNKQQRQRDLTGI